MQWQNMIKQFHKNQKNKLPVYVKLVRNPTKNKKNRKSENVNTLGWKDFLLSFTECVDKPKIQKLRYIAHSKICFRGIMKHTAECLLC